MPRTAQGLTAGKVAKAGPGRYGDGAGLYLVVRKPRRAGAPTQRFWVFRYVRNSRMHEMGLGGASGRTGVSLVEARDKAHDLYQIHRSGRDPLAEKKAAKAAALIATGKAVTFKAEAERYVAAQAPGWRNAKHAAQWSATLETYAYPLLGALPVSAIEAAHVLKVLEPIWKKKPETAARLRGRIEAVLDAAKVRGYREGENPARWKGNLAHLLPARGKVKRPEHHAALPYARIGSFMITLRKQQGTAPRALEFAILTAARTGEVIGATWAEINLRDKVWTLPAGRVKSGREHRVPLCSRALQILGKAGRGYLFPGTRPDEPLSNMALLMLLRRMNYDDVTVHGFRSAFRDWAAERTNYPSEVAEMALAHAVGNRVEAAYRRGDLFEKRRHLANEWATYCATIPQPKCGTVVPIRRRARA